MLRSLGSNTVSPVAHAVETVLVVQQSLDAAGVLQRRDLKKQPRLPAEAVGSEVSVKPAIRSVVRLFMGAFYYRARGKRGGDPASRPVKSIVVEAAKCKAVRGDFPESAMTLIFRRFQPSETKMSRPRMVVAQRNLPGNHGNR